MSVPNLSTTREERLYQEQIEDLQELALDPTLQSCCQRDLEDQIRIAKYKALLTPQDRSQARNRLAGQVVATPAGINGSDDDEDDAELGESGRVQPLVA